MVATGEVADLLRVSDAFSMSPTFRGPITGATALGVAIGVMDTPYLPTAVVGVGVEGPVDVVDSMSHFDPQVPRPVLLLIPLDDALSPL